MTPAQWVTLIGAVTALVTALTALYHALAAKRQVAAVTPAQQPASGAGASSPASQQPPRS